MSNANLAALSGGMLVAGVVAVLGVGPLDPPAGPVMPTGVSLEELANQLGNVESQLDVVANYLSPLLVASTGPNPIDINHGSEINLLNETAYIERIIYTSEFNSFVQLRDGNGTMISPGHRRADGTTTVVLDLGVIAQNGLVFSNLNIPGSNTGNGWFQVSVFYREATN
ncbi:MAG: hypothetical protein KDA31_03405 [Phycisphaerales bacterium]|nr:hypothetical protein [Phycisphaerales bacterium]MCB9835313.1 hypothetical protein [Phycisphaera sp.]